MSRCAAVIVSVLLLGVGGCAKDQPNPFLAQTLTTLPRPDDTLIFTSNAYGETGGQPREVYSVGLANEPQRLTICNNSSRACDHLEAVPSPDGRKIAARRVSADSNGDGLFTEADATSLVLIDLTRSVEGTLVPDTRSVSGVDWSPVDDLLVYTGASVQDTEDLFRILPNGTDDRPVVVTPDIIERSPRFDPTGFNAVFEGTDATGQGRIYVLNLPTSIAITSGGPGSEPLPGTPYRVGADADPAYSPDGRQIVFRRLVATGNGGFGVWDLLVVAYDGSSQRSLASGPIYRGAPDWSTQGIAFVEIDAAAGRASLVVLQPDGSGRSVLVSGTALLSNPRWLR